MVLRYGNLRDRLQLGAVAGAVEVGAPVCGDSVCRGDVSAVGDFVFSGAEMKNGRLQVKDIETLPILRVILECRDGVGMELGLNWGVSQPQRSVRGAFPEGCPDRLILAKMRRLIERGLVSGCACGCRGDFKLTGKGAAMANPVV